MTTATTDRTLALGGRRYPLVLPSLRDPRLHLASVVISIHVLGQLGLGFRVSIPQILVAILTSAAIELVWTFVRTRQVVWPASAMLTGSGVALIFRVVGTERGDHWSWQGWHLFALVAAGSLLSKYLIRWRGTHVFNPSNFGLVVAFLLLGSSRVEPLDFWWSPLNGWMVAAYAIIVVGGLAITARLHLLEMAVSFWVVFAASLGLLTASGHCMTAAWAFTPVCGSTFWWVVVTSPEVLIFLFFMITDPRTVPRGRAARVAFAVAIAVLATILIAPQTTEFGAKVGLLSALVVFSAVRSWFDWVLSAGDVRRSPVTVAVDRLMAGTEGVAARVFSRGVMVGSAVAVIAVVVVAAGLPARVAATDAPAEGGVTVEIDPSSLPPVTIDPEVATLGGDLVGDGGSGLATILAESLAVEAEAMRLGDQSLLLEVDQGLRLLEMEQLIDEAAARGERVVETYVFDSIHVRVVHNEGPQTAPNLAFDTTGTLETATFGIGDAPLDVRVTPVSRTFILRQGSGERWVVVEVSDT